MSDNRRPRLPSAWIWTTVAQVGEVCLGRQRSPKNRSNEYPTKYIRAANVTWKGLDLTDVLEMDFKPQAREKYQLRPGDIVLSEASGSLDEVGKPAIWRGEIKRCCFQNTVIRFRPYGACPEYFLELFRHYALSGTFSASSHGVGIHHLGAERFSAIPVPLAPLAEQRRIVERIQEMLTQLDAGVALLEQVRAKLQRCRAAVLKAACEGRLVPTEAELARAEGRDYEPADRLLARILRDRRARWEADELARLTGGGKAPKDDSWKSRYAEPPGPVTGGLPRLPDGWTWATVGAMLAEPLCNGISVKGSDTPPGVPALRLNAMTDRGFDYTVVRYLPIDEATAEDLAVVEGDFFVSRGNGSLSLVGRGTPAHTPPFRVVFPDTMIRLRLNETVRRTRWVPTIWASDWVRHQVEKKVKTTAGIWKIAQPDVASLILPFPPLAEQQRIVAEVERRLSLLDGLEAAVAANLRRAGRLRQAILKRAFEGKLVPQDPNDEPASVLLERIRQERAGEPAGRPRRGREFRRTVAPGDVG